MDQISVVLIAILFAIVIYLWYTKIKMRNIIMELEYMVEELHKRVEEHEGLHVEDAHKNNVRKKKED